MKQPSFLICPADRTPLILNNNAHCPKCRVDYKIANGIWRLYSPDDKSGTRKDVVQWFNKRAQTIEDEQILRGTPDKWHKRFFEKDVQIIQEFLKFNKNDCILDIGCGNGLFLERYKNFASQAVGIDVSLHMLERSKRRLAGNNILLAQANSLKLPFANSTFEAIICNWMIHYLKWEEISEFFSQLRRTIKKNGRIFVGEIPVKHSLRSYEAAIGHFLTKILPIKVSESFLSPVETTKFRIKELENLAFKEGLRVIIKGTMRHVLPSLRTPYIGQLVPNRIQHLFERYDYEKSIPLISHSYFMVLTK